MYHIINHCCGDTACFGDVHPWSGQLSPKAAQIPLISSSECTAACPHAMVNAALNTLLPSFDSPMAMTERRPLSETATWHTGHIVLNFEDGPHENNPKMALEQARGISMRQDLFVVMRICSLLIFSHWHARFEPQCRHKDFWTACLLPLLAADVAASKICC